LVLSLWFDPSLVQSADKEWDQPGTVLARAKKCSDLWTAAVAAGRVQSVALRLVAEREAEIQAFVPQHYWTVAATLQTDTGATFQASLRPQAQPVCLLLLGCGGLLAPGRVPA
jgi:DNA topoisomerase